MKSIASVLNVSTDTKGGMLKSNDGSSVTILISSVSEAKKLASLSRRILVFKLHSQSDSIVVVYQINLVLGKYPKDNPIDSLDSQVKYLKDKILLSVSSGEFTQSLCNISMIYGASSLANSSVSQVPSFSFVSYSTSDVGAKMKAKESSPLDVGKPGFWSVIFIGVFFIISIFIAAMFYRNKAICKKNGTEESNLDKNHEIFMSYLKKHNIELTESKDNSMHQIENPKNNQMVDYEELNANSFFIPETNQSLPQVSNNIQEDKYVGEYKNGKRHGYGKKSYANGATYDGYWANDFKNGHGKYISFTGKVYVGEFKNNLFHGKGRYVYPSGNCYTGEFSGGKMHGVGTFSYASGKEYHGQYQHGIIQGKGRYKYPNGSYYEGYFSSGKYCGRGIFKFPSGARYEGEFEDDKPTGNGMFYNPDGSIALSSDNVL
jgi:hypothetical protein